MKGYEEQCYPVEVEVVIKLGEDVWEDGIKGLNEGHALYLARENWPGCEVLLHRVIGNK